MSPGSEISAMPVDDEDLVYTPSKQNIHARPPFRTPSAVRAIQMSSPTPSVINGNKSPNRAKSRTSQSSHQSPRPSSSRTATPSSHTPTLKKKGTPGVFNFKTEHPLVLLHVTVLPLHFPYSSLLDSGEPLPESVQFIRETWRLLQDKLGDLILNRGVLLPHPQDSYEVLEEVLLDALELPIRKRGEVLKCGHYLSASSADLLPIYDESESEASYEDSDAESMDESANKFANVTKRYRDKHHVCPTCERTVKIDKSRKNVPKERRFRVKVYASNGLMGAGAWQAAWREMERVDVEIEPFVREEVVAELDTLQNLWGKHVEEMEKRAEEQRQQEFEDEQQQQQEEFAQQQREEFARQRQQEFEDDQRQQQEEFDQRQQQEEFAQKQQEEFAQHQEEEFARQQQEEFAQQQREYEQHDIEQDEQHEIPEFVQEDQEDPQEHAEEFSEQKDEPEAHLEEETTNIETEQISAEETQDQPRETFEEQTENASEPTPQFSNEEHLHQSSSAQRLREIYGNGPEVLEKVQSAHASVTDSRPQSRQVHGSHSSFGNSNGQSTPVPIHALASRLQGLHSPSPSRSPERFKPRMHSNSPSLSSGYANMGANLEYGYVGARGLDPGERDYNYAHNEEHSERGGDLLRERLRRRTEKGREPQRFGEGLAPQQPQQQHNEAETNSTGEGVKRSAKIRESDSFLELLLAAFKVALRDRKNIVILIMGMLILFFALKPTSTTMLQSLGPEHERENIGNSIMTGMKESIRYEPHRHERQSKDYEYEYMEDIEEQITPLPSKKLERQNRPEAPKTKLKPKAAAPATAALKSQKVKGGKPCPDKLQVKKRATNPIAQQPVVHTQELPAKRSKIESTDSMSNKNTKYVDVKPEVDVGDDEEHADVEEEIVVAVEEMDERGDGNEDEAESEDGLEDVPMAKRFDAVMEDASTSFDEEIAVTLEV